MEQLVQSVESEISSNQQQIRQLDNFLTEYRALDGLLETMPQLPVNPPPRVLIPLGSKAGYFYGTLKHTNEIMAHLGDNYFTKMTASQARQLVSKHMKELDDQIALLRGEKKHLDEKVGIAKELSAESGDSQEIKEPYAEETEKEWLEKHRASVAREREAVRKERERAKASGSLEEDPLAKLLQVKDEEEEVEPPQPSPRQRSDSIEKRVTWDRSPSKVGEKTTADNRIVFRHSSSPSSPPPSSGETIVSPADVYTMFSSKVAPKSILKNKVSETKRASSPASFIEEKPSEPNPFLPPSTAVSDKVVERTPLPLSESAQSNSGAGATRATSRFRKERNIQSSNN